MNFEEEGYKGKAERKHSFIWNSEQDLWAAAQENEQSCFRVPGVTKMEQLL